MKIKTKILRKIKKNWKGIAEWFFIFNLLMLLSFLSVEIGYLFAEPDEEIFHESVEAGWIEGESLSIKFLDIWQGDSTFIRHCKPWQNDKDCFEVLVDAWDSLNSKILMDNWIFDIDLFVATHKDKDHIWWAPLVLNKYDIEYIWRNWNTKKKSTKTITNFFNAINREVKEISSSDIIPKSWESYNFNGLEIKICNGKNESINANHSSLVLLLIYNNYKLLIMWDAEIPNFQEIYENCGQHTLNSIRVWHHWSKISLNNEILEKFEPKNAVISVWLNNRYKHPSNEVINLLKDKDITIYRTDKNWTISMEVYWKSWYRINKEKK